MHDSDQMDVYMVCGDKDIRLLRHFLTSYKLFFKSPGKIFLWAWKRHEYLLQGIELPDNLTLLYKDDVPELTEDDFKNQMYLKLIAHKYVESDWFWVADTDYLIVSPLNKTDFFKGKKPYWFYCKWHEIAEKTFRSGSEAFLERQIPFQFLDEPQFIHSKKISSAFAAKHAPINLLHPEYLAAEQVVYGAYAYENFFDLYEWVDEATNNGPVVSYKVNQRPPSYCELDDDVKLIDLPVAKYYVFWSHWEKAEQKMIEFLVDAQLKFFGKLQTQPSSSKLFRYWLPAEIDSGSKVGIDGIYSDGWLMRDVWFCILADERFVLSLELFVPYPPSGESDSLHLNINSNGKCQTVRLEPGSQAVRIPLDKYVENRVTFRFEGGFSEPNGFRKLFALLSKFELELNY